MLFARPLGMSDPATTTTPPRLLDQVRASIRLRHYSRRTEEAYVGWIRRYIVFHGKRHPREMRSPEVAAFLSHLAERGGVAASTQNQALCALLFLYRQVLDRPLDPLPGVAWAKKSSHVPVVLSQDEVARVLDHLRGSTWLIVVLPYGAGLRLNECLDLRVKDLDFDRRQITVRCRRWRLTRSCGTWTTSGDCIGETSRVVMAGWCCLMRWRANIRTRRPSGDGSSCCRRPASAAIRSGVRRAGIDCTSRPCSARWSRRRGWPGLRSGCRATCFVTASRRTCLKRGLTSGRCRNCWATRMSVRP